MNTDDSNMGTADLDPTNPVVMAMELKQIRSTLDKLMTAVDKLAERPTCPKPGLCVNHEDQINDLKESIKELHDLSKEWQKIAAEREKRLGKAEDRIEAQRQEIENLQKGIIALSGRLQPFEDAAQQATGGKKVLYALWTLATGGVLTWVFMLWKLVEANTGK